MFLWGSSKSVSGNPGPYIPPQQSTDREPNGEEATLHVVAAMQRGRLANLDEELALDAAKTLFETKLPIADSVTLATVRAYQTTLWTQDADFEGMAGVRYVEKR